MNVPSAGKPGCAGITNVTPAALTLALSPTGTIQGGRGKTDVNGDALATIGRRLEYPIHLLLLLCALGAPAQTNQSLPDSVIQGRQLAQKILDQTPPENSIVTGNLLIRGADGTRSSIPLDCAIIARGSGWEAIYQAAGTNRAEILRIQHSATGSNRYFLETNQTVLSPGQLASWQTSIPGPKPLSGAEITAPFVGSDFCLADLGLEFLHWPGQKLLKLEIHRSRGCTVLESANPDPSSGGYSRVVSWIDSETLGIVEAYAYDANGRKLKDFYPKDFKKVGGQWQVQTLVMENLETGSRSRMEFDLKK